MTSTYSFQDKDGDRAGVEALTDREQGPVLWLQTTSNGCYIPTSRLDEFIDGLRAAANGGASDA